MVRNKLGGRFSPLVLALAISLLPPSLRAEFALNFQPNPNVVPSWANWSCNAGGGGGMGGMGGGMGMFGPGCGSDYFLQELIDDNGIQYYHVIVGDPTVDDFALEFYMRIGDGGNWWPTGGRRGGGMGMGLGPAPYSSSYGDVNDPLASAWLPLASADLVGNGTGNPNRVYMRQINNDAQMQQEFIKDRETQKPRIVQVVQEGSFSSNFDLDMRNGDHNTFTDPVLFINETTVPDFATFDAADPVTAPRAHINAGRYIYTADNPLGAPHGDAYGTYTYEDGGFDVYGTDWLSYCIPDQNPDHNCNFSRGGMGMGGRGGRR